MDRTLAFLAAAVAAAFLGFSGYRAFFAASQDDPFADCRQGQAAGADIGGPFTLVNSEGQTVTDADVLTAPTLVYFGYTFCPDVCPLDMSLNAEAADIVEAGGDKLNLVFITIDPARDTPQVVGDFATNIHPRAIGLTGSDAQITAAAKAYRAYFKKQDGDPEFYLMDHSAMTYLVLPGLGFADFYRHDATAAARAESAACFIKAAAAKN